jgi:hypothetical protein
VSLTITVIFINRFGRVNFVLEMEKAEEFDATAQAAEKKSGSISTHTSEEEKEPLAGAFATYVISG